jgi:hypothetical protein
MTGPNPLQLANTAQQMARNAPKDDAVVFNKVAMICMGVMATASVLQVIKPLLRELLRKHDRETPDIGCRAIPMPPGATGSGSIF